ncbi:OsmC family protein [Bacteroidales bacterium OttesenSCG-928-L19]|nr:OsmC family protein [Bacteroidales bacterium OttesenSCG-928-L19]
MKSTAIWTKGFQSVVDNGRNHSVIIDLPEAKGGENAGPTALELSVMSFCGCVSTIFTMLAPKMRISFDHLKVEVFAEQESGAKTITDIHCVLYVTTSSSLEEIEKCLEHTVNNCPVGLIFRQAGVEISLEVIHELPSCSGA